MMRNTTAGEKGAAAGRERGVQPSLVIGITVAGAQVDRQKKERRSDFVTVCCMKAVCCMV